MSLTNSSATDKQEAGPGHTPAHPASPDALSPKLDSPLRTLLGLIVLWGSLVLIFSAHRFSESYIRLETPIGIKNSASLDQSILQSLDPRVELLLPFSMYLGGTSPRQALANIAAHVGFTISEEDLKELSGKEIRTIHYENLPLYKALYDLIQKPSLGFAIQGRTIKIIKQKLEEETGGKAGHGINFGWKAELELSKDPLLIIPTGKTDVGFFIHLTRDERQTDGQYNLVQVEVLKGSECLTMAKAQFDENGNAKTSSMSNAQSIALTVARKGKPQPNKPGRFALEFYYQSFE